MNRSNRGHGVKAVSPRAALHTTPWAIISSARSAEGGDRATCRDLPAGHSEALPPAAQRLRRAFGQLRAPLRVSGRGHGVVHVGGAADKLRQLLQARVSASRLQA